MIDPNELRKDFPILSRKINGRTIVYFDNAATSQKPIQVIEAIKEFYEKSNANIHRAIHTLSQEATKLYEEAHEKVAEFINADGIEEIVFVKNTTEAINLVAYAWGLKNLREGDEVIVTLMDHHSNLVPWIILSELRGIKVKYVNLNEDGTLRYRDFEELISSKTKLICMPHVSNVLGVVNDVKRVSKLARENECLLLVDGAQSVPHMPVNVKDVGADFLAFSGHKMLGPTGIGVLYCRREILAEMNPFLGGGDMIKEVRYAGGKCIVSWNDLPWKFEAGTPNIAGAIGLMKAIEYLSRVGMRNVERHEKKLVDYSLKRMGEMSEVEVYGPREIELRSGIIPFNVRGFESSEVAMFLDSMAIMVRSGYHCAQPLHQQLGISSSVRASFYLYNTFDEIDQFMDALMQLVGGQGYE